MKKGFTLIELLAVIVIVAIITLIATPIISNIVNNSKVGALKSSAYGILEASNLYYAQNGSKGIRFDINDNVISSNDTTKLLNYKGSIKRGTVIIDKKGNTIICITDGTNSAYKNYDEQDVKTVTKETCNIPSSSSIVYLENSGATITELTNKQLTERIDQLEQTIETISTIANSSTLDKVYPIGSVYMSMTENTKEKVEEKLGGTWEQIEDRFLLAAGSTYPINTTGGYASTTLSIENMPSHNHNIPALTGTATTGGAWSFRLNAALPNSTGVHLIVGASGAATSYSGSYGNFQLSSTSYRTDTGRNVNTISHNGHTHSITTNEDTTDSQGSGTAFTNMPPYITVYMYKRIG